VEQDKESIAAVCLEELERDSAGGTTADVVHVHEAIEVTEGNTVSVLPQPRQHSKGSGMQKPSCAASGCSAYTGPAGCFVSVGCKFPG